MVVAIATSNRSSGGEFQRIIESAASPGWSLGLGRRGQIMATSDTGVVGMPLVVTAEKRGRGMVVSRYAPGDDIDAEGDVIGDLTGNPREMGRQLRSFLEAEDVSS